MKNPIKGIVFVGLLTLGADGLQAENWPQFRGPTAQGLSTEKNLPLTWSATENVAWKTALPGGSWSSPLVWGDRVFVTTAMDGGESCRVLSLERKTGKILWEKEVFKQVQRRKQARNTFATPKPATDGERVYAAFNDGSFVGLKFDGSLAWENRDYKFFGEHGLGSSLILHNGLLIMARDGSRDGEDKKIGWQQAWDQARARTFNSTTEILCWPASVPQLPSAQIALRFQHHEPSANSNPELPVHAPGDHRACG